MRLSIEILIILESPGDYCEVIIDELESPEDGWETIYIYIHGFDLILTFSALRDVSGLAQLLDLKFRLLDIGVIDLVFN